MHDNGTESQIIPTMARGATHPAVNHKGRQVPKTEKNKTEISQRESKNATRKRGRECGKRGERNNLVTTSPSYLKVPRVNG